MSGNVDTQYASQLTDYELSTKFLEYSLIWEVLVLAPGMLAIPAAVWYFIASNEDIETRKAKFYKKLRHKLVTRLGVSNAIAAWQTGVGLVPKHTAESGTTAEATGTRAGHGEDQAPQHDQFIKLDVGIVEPIIIINKPVG